MLVQWCLQRWPNNNSTFVKRWPTGVAYEILIQWWVNNGESALARLSCLSFHVCWGHRLNADLMLSHRLRRWPSIKIALDRCLVSTGYSYPTQTIHWPIIGLMPGQRRYGIQGLKKFLPCSLVNYGEPLLPLCFRGSVLGIRPPELEFRILCREGMSSDSSHHHQELILAQSSLYVVLKLFYLSASCFYNETHLFVLPTIILGHDMKTYQKI